MCQGTRVSIFDYDYDYRLICIQVSSQQPQMLPRRDQYVKMPMQTFGNFVPRSQLTDEQNFRYYNQHNKLYYSAYCINTQMKQIVQVGVQIKQKLQNIQKSIEDIKKVVVVPLGEKVQYRPKRFRRTNDMIEKPFACTYQKCDKIYASQGSLQQHIKLKHQRQGKGQSKQQQLQQDSQQNYDGEEPSSYSQGNRNQKRSALRSNNQ